MSELKTLVEDDAKLVKVLREEFEIHNSTAWKIMKMIREADKLNAMKWVKMEKSQITLGTEDWFEGRIDLLKHLFTLIEEDPEEVEDRDG